MKMRLHEVKKGVYINPDHIVKVMDRSAQNAPVNHCDVEVFMSTGIILTFNGTTAEKWIKTLTINGDFVDVFRPTAVMKGK